jgi:hypothetical protein
MTRRETRKTSPERRARIGTECLESRNLLSVGAVAPAQLISAPPSGAYQTALLSAPEPGTYMKITGPRESVAYFKQDDVTKISGSYQTSVQGATGPIAQLKYTFEAPAVSGSYQTSLTGGTAWDTYMKIPGAKESVAHSKQDSPQTALWSASGPGAQMKITGPDVSPQTAPSAARDSFNFG